MSRLSGSGSTKSLLVMSFVLMVVAQVSASDTQPPTLTSFTFSPMAIDTTTTSASVTVTAQVTDNLSGVSGVTVQFLSPSENQEQQCGLNLVSGTNLNGTYQCVIVVPAFSEAGTWTVSNVFVVDKTGNLQFYFTSDLQALGFPTQLIVDSTTTVVLASSANPSTYTQPVTFTATATSTNGNTPTGAVNFNEGSTTIGSVALDGGGIATLTMSSLSVGTHTIVAEYLGDANNPAADSAPLVQTVNKATTITTVTSSQNPSIAGHSATFTAEVSFAAGIPPDGESVQFFDGKGKLGTATLTNGAATLSTSRLIPGLHQIWAQYMGDANLASSKSIPLRQGVKR